MMDYSLNVAEKLCVFAFLYIFGDLFKNDIAYLSSMKFS